MAAILCFVLFMVSFSWGGTLSVVESNIGSAAGYKIQATVANGFATSFTMRKGFGHDWFDLKNDPGKTRDIAPANVENGLFWVKICPALPAPQGDPYYCNPPQRMTLLESSPVRLRVNMTGPHMRYGHTQFDLTTEAWNDLWYDLTFTLYADGKTYIAYAIENKSASPIDLGGYLPFITKSTDQWGPDVHILNDLGPFVNKTGQTSWQLQWSNGPTYFQDILMVMQKGLYSNSYWGAGSSYKDLRTSFDCRGIFNYQVPVGKNWIYVLMAFSDKINDSAVANAYAKDYRAPDAISATNGQLVKSDAGDKDADGFNEGEGCYVLNAGTNGAAFTIHGSATKRVDPAFKIKGWKWAVPSTISVGGATLSKGTGYNAAAVGGDLVLQVLQTIQTDANVNIPGTGVPTSIKITPVMGKLNFTTAPGSRIFDISGRQISTGLFWGIPAQHAAKGVCITENKIKTIRFYTGK